jgi:hypothetical protein
MFVLCIIVQRYKLFPRLPNFHEKSYPPRTKSIGTGIGTIASSLAQTVSLFVGKDTAKRSKNQKKRAKIRLF